MQKDKKQERFEKYLSDNKKRVRGEDNGQELLDCPFCGGKAITSTYYIECECEVAPRIDWFHEDKKAAITAWNTRAKPLPDDNAKFITKNPDNGKEHPKEINEVVLLIHKWQTGNWHILGLKDKYLLEASTLLKECEDILLTSQPLAPLPDNKEAGELVEEIEKLEAIQELRQKPSRDAKTINAIYKADKYLQTHGHEFIALLSRCKAFLIAPKKFDNKFLKIIIKGLELIEGKSAFYSDVHAEEIKLGEKSDAEIRQLSNINLLARDMLKALKATPQPPATGDDVVEKLPDELSKDESAALLKKAEELWKDLQNNNLGGYSGINRPFFIVSEFKEAIEQFGRRDVGLTWSDYRKQEVKKKIAAINHKDNWFETRVAEAKASQETRPDWDKQTVRKYEDNEGVK